MAAMADSIPESREPRSLDIPRELAKLIRDSPNLRRLLDEAVELIAERLVVDVCSIYLLDPTDHRLWLVASHGFRPEAVGQISLALEEGLTGEVVSQLQRLAVADAPSHPRYRYFPETGEEEYHSYLGEPLSIDGRPVGSIVLRTHEEREFTTEERETLSAIAGQLVTLVENARLVEALYRPAESGRAYWQEVRGPRADQAGEEGKLTAGLRGTPIADGIAIAEAVVLARSSGGDEEEGPVDPVVELTRLEGALRRSREELEAIQQFTRREAGEDFALIFGSHLLMLSDDMLERRMRVAIEEGAPAARAVKRVFAEASELLELARDPYLRHRAEDLSDLRQRLELALSGPESAHPPVEGRIAVVPRLTASAVVELRARGATGIVAEHGGSTSHGALLARSFGLPTVGGLADASRLISTGDPVALDGAEGVVIVRPDLEVVQAMRVRIEVRQAARARREELRDLEAVTTDGRRISMMANVGLSADLAIAAENGAEGVGLYRTELPFLLRDTMPSRSEQVRLYSRVFDALPGRPATFRTLDIGGDKFMRGGDQGEANPFLGHRAIRLSLDHPETFIAQLQAILIASLEHDAHVMIPLVSQVAEVRRARQALRQASEALTAEGIPHNDSVPLGVMIEVPGAVEIAPALAREVDFFSIGTNDLIQYSLAVDRGNEKVAHLGDPFHPAVLSLIRRTVEAGRAAGIPVSVCGEMAGKPETALLLLGLGVEILSLNGGAIPAVKEAIRGASYAELESRARDLPTLPGPEEVREAWLRADDRRGAPTPGTPRSPRE